MESLQVTQRLADLQGKSVCLFARHFVLDKHLLEFLVLGLTCGQPSGLPYLIWLQQGGTRGGGGVGESLVSKTSLGQFLFFKKP